MLNVRGRSDLYLKLEIIKKILAIPTILIGIIWGIKVMILGMWVNSIISYYLNSYYSGRLVSYPICEQLEDIVPSLYIALFMGVIVFIIGKLIPLGAASAFLVQILLGSILIIVISELFKMESYFFIKETIKAKFKTINNA